VEEAAEEVSVSKFEHKGVKYLKSPDNMLYSAADQELVGKWNPETKEIEELEEEEYESEEEEEEEEEEEDA